MKALVIQSDLSFKIQDKDKPTPKEGEALVKLLAASLNRRDQWIREGKYPSIMAGVTIGSDGMGEVVEVGGQIESPWIGKKVLINPNINWGDDNDTQQDDYQVLGLPTDGTLAEYIVVKLDRLVEKPTHLTDSEAAAIPLSALTAYRACFTKGGVQKGTRVLISGFGGGVAQMAALFSITVGADTYVTSSSKANIDLAKEKGAREGFDYTVKDWYKNVRKRHGGFDVIIDSAGGNQFDQLIKLLNPKGRLVFYGATNGLPATIDLYTMFWRQLSVVGTTMGSDKEFERMVEFVKSFHIIPMVGSVKPFSQVLDALDEMKRGGTMGKIVLTF
ncbi:MAG: zinc-binding dehydrogenase [Cyclobacteriaceae bacterium]|nr:zinc-binding dehydrogenase [Cyclobacteriaceae bacterium]